MRNPLSRRHALKLTLALCAAPQAFAQTPGPALPSTIRIVVPFPAGGAVDVTVRRISEQMARILGTAVIVENRPGAAGLIAIRAVAPAPGDGSALLYAHSGLVTAQAMGGKYDLLKEFKPLAKLTVGPHLLVVRADAPYRSQRDLIEAMKAQPGKLNFGSGGPGSPTHLMYEMLEEAVPGIKATHVPFKGAIDAVYALAGGEIDFQFALPGAAGEFIKSGKLRALSTTGAKRFAAMPDLPTVAEAGVPGYSAEPWGGLLIPAKAADALVARLAEASVQAVNTPEVTQLIVQGGSRKADANSPAEFAQDIGRELGEHRALVKKLGMVNE